MQDETQPQAPSVPPTPVPISPPAPVTPFSPQPATPTPPPAPHSKKKIIVIAIIALIVLISVAAAIYFFSPVFKTETNNVTPSAESIDNARPADKPSMTAKTTADLAEVCNGSRISNAIATIKPYSIIAFSQSNDGTSWTSFVYTGTGKESFSNDLTTANVVMCMTPDPTTVTGAVSCKMKNPTTTETYAGTYRGVTYVINFFNPQTGVAIGASTVKTDAACSTFATEGGDHYTLPTDDKLSTVIAQFLAS